MRDRSNIARLGRAFGARLRVIAESPFFPAMAIALALLATLPRFQYSWMSGRYLWAEDGPTFFNQARHGGVAVLTIPYAGYLHLYPRLVAWLSSDLSLILQPIVYIAAWLIAFGVMVTTITKRGRAMGLDPVTTCGVVLLIALQPTSDEIFFNLTNCQWLLGLALTVQMLTLQDGRKAPWQWFGLAVLCLTGPFCLVILPFVLAFQFLNQSIRKNFAFLILFVVCAAVQLFFLVTTDRTAGRTEEVAPLPVIKAMVKVLLFLPDSVYQWAPSIGFWSVYSALLSLAVARRKTRAMMETRVVLLLLVVAVAFLTAPMVTGAFPVRILHDGANRYTWIPYALIIFSAALVSSRWNGARLWMAACLSVICLSKYGPVERYDFHYASFVKLAAVVPAGIPINPTRSNLVWQLETAPSSGAEAVDATRGTNDWQKAASQSYEGPDAFADLSSRKIVCDRATDVAIELEGDHLNDGTVALSWSPSADFARIDSMERRFKRGEVRMQYAFSYPPDGTYLRSLQLNDPDVVRIRRATVFCLR